MKNVKKLLSILCVLMLAILSLTGCGTSTNQTDKPADATEKVVEETVEETVAETNYAEEAEKTMLTLANAKTEDEIKSVLTEDSYDTASDIKAIFPDDNYTVSVKLLGTYKEYDVYDFEVSNKDYEEPFSGWGLFKKENDSYLFCNNRSILDSAAQTAQCSMCGGSGSIYNGGNVCAICSGSGQQYNPNANFDPNLNMYSGAYVACSGCGGAGRTGGNTTVCASCGGAGLIFN